MSSMTLADALSGLVVLLAVVTLAGTAWRRRQDSKLYLRLRVALETEGQASDRTLAAMEEESQETLMLLQEAERRLDRRQGQRD